MEELLTSPAASKLPIMKSLLFLLLTNSCLCADPDGLLLDLIVPPSQADRFQHAEFSFWVADPSKPVKAVIIHQHGCTNASPEKHPPITGDWHWRALARKHDAALLVPMYQVAKGCDEWNDPDSGSERALFTALEDFAQRSKRPEMKDAPWVLWGHSGGSSWSAQMIVRHPKRVLAASFRGGCHKQFGVPEFRAKFAEAARDLPLLLVWGKRESVPTSSHFVSWGPMNTIYRELREHGGKVCRVIDPRSEHGCDDSRLISIGFFDTVLSGQATGEPVKGADTVWFPNESFAELSREFSEHGTLKPRKPPSLAPELEIKKDATGHTLLTWRVIPEISGGLRALRFYRDGRLWKEIGLKSADFLATSRDSTPEVLRLQELSDDSLESHTYKLTFIDAAGNESP